MLRRPARCARRRTRAGLFLFAIVAGCFSSIEAKASTKFQKELSAAIERMLRQHELVNESGNGFRDHDPLRHRSIEPLLMPVLGAHRNELVDTFGAARDGGRRHEGIDIFAPRGSPVIAVANGAIELGWHPRAGRYVRLTSDGGRSFYYAHLDAWPENLRGGDFVRRGQVVGYVGNSGNARWTRCHLHFEVRENDIAVNPFPLLTIARSGRPDRTGAPIAQGR